jgi:hypothetical protein
MSEILSDNMALIIYAVMMLGIAYFFNRKKV